jgi:hypothetical protein
MACETASSEELARLEVVARVGVTADLVVFVREVRWIPKVPEVRSKEELPSKIT